MKNDGIVTIRKFGKNIMLGDDVIYTEPKNKTFHTDLTKCDVKGFKYSHTEKKENGTDVFIYKPNSN